MATFTSNHVRKDYQITFSYMITPTALCAWAKYTVTAVERKQNMDLIMSEWFFMS